MLMPRASAAVVAVAASLTLAGCYTSTTPLITPAQAAFPYQSITYMAAGESAVTMTHKGDAYVSVDDKGNTTELLFMPLTPPYYVAQLHLNMDHKDGYLYGLLKVDLAAKTAAAYALVADKTDIGPGLPACSDSDSTVCLTQLKPYIDHAMKLAASAKPDTVYNLSDLK